MTRPVPIDDLAEFLGVPKSTIYTWTHQNRIPYYKVGRHLRFDLVKVLESLEKPANSSPGMRPRESYSDSLKIEKEMKKRRDLHERRLK